MNIDETLAERGERYGDFEGHADITQSLKRAMYAEGWEGLEDDQREALEMIAHKIGRIINGNPDYVDSWTDIIGYARLVEKRLLDGQDRVDKPRNIKEELDAARKKIEGLKPPCDNPACPACNPKVSAAIETLIEAGILNFKE